MNGTKKQPCCPCDRQYCGNCSCPSCVAEKEKMKQEGKKYEERDCACAKKPRCY